MSSGLFTGLNNAGYPLELVGFNATTNSVDVEFVFNSSEHLVTAVTIGKHPLVGVRKFQVVDAGYHLTTNKGLIRFETEAYEQANELQYIPGFGKINFENYSSIWEGQDKLWTTYVNNIEAYWRHKYGASQVGLGERDLSGGGGNVNPFRSELPAHLRESRHYK